MTEKRRKAIVRRRIFIAIMASVLAAIIALLTVLIVAIKNGFNKDDPASPDYVSSETASTETPTLPQNEIFVTPTGVELNKNFGRLLLTNGKNPLPDEYDTKVREYLVEIDPQYRNNDNVTKIHRDVYPYITAMVAAAQADGVDLRVWSPFRDYNTQNILFQRQVTKYGGDEEKTSTVVARPGTSEHNTGLCADFNMADDEFQQTEMYTWMCEHAEDYGFILRYPKEKEHVTGVIYESWHWRFVGINNAKAINKLGVTLEEYIEMNGFDPAMDMYGDDSQNNSAEQITD